ncbi:hypothetical protein B0J11DRAFT_583136 [Dendryphion nanum]|uniref:Uncharacterized protein n=1 Tax=Dendryphion nanum TaxID=256645 RepID=A0A9P9DEX9_9PLEO|nr:hypothetical protein B0J11DRAFT_583136 [Dendryphion nanum]
MLPPELLERKYGFDVRASTLSRQLLDGMYGRHARDPKDMAFGMWAVLKRFSDHQLPEADYTDDIGSIYRTFASIWITTFRSLDPLFLAAAKGVHGQPSWVPDLAGYGRHTWRSVTNISSFSSFGNNDRYGRQEELPLMEFNDSRTVLTVRACHIATVTMEIKFRFKIEAKSPDGTNYQGKCSVDAQEGDHIIRVLGLGQLLLVRSYPDHEYNLSQSPRAVTVISPIELDRDIVFFVFPLTRMIKFFSSIGRTVPEQSVESQYVQYHIY